MSAFDGYYLTGDGGHLDADGYVFVMGRTDDVINVAGHRLSTGGMEEVLAAHPDVAECAVIGVADPMKGQVPRGFVVLKAGVDAARARAELRAELVQLVRDQIGAVASLRDVAVVPALPKTRSGQDPAQDHARHRRRRRRAGAVHDRRRVASWTPCARSCGRSDQPGVTRPGSSVDDPFDGRNSSPAPPCGRHRTPEAPPMDGTRTARIAAITAAVALAVALTAATLLTTGTRNGLDTGRSSAVLTDRSPVLLRSAEHGDVGRRTAHDSAADAARAGPRTGTDGGGGDRRAPLTGPG